MLKVIEKSSYFNFSTTFGAQLFKHMPSLAAVIDRDYRIVLSNNKFDDKFGESDGQLCYCVYKKYNSICKHCAAQKTFVDGKVRVMEEKGVDSRGMPTFYVVHFVPLFDDDTGQITHVVKMSYDVTEQLEKERLAAVGETVAIIAHAIKNILVGLQGGMYKLKSGHKKDSSDLVNKGWEIMDRNFSRVARLTKGLLMMSRKSTLARSKVSPNTIANNVYNLYKDAAEEAGITLETNFSDKCCSVELDVQGIHECLENLLSNAIDACKTSGTTDKTITIDTQLSDSELVFEIYDSAEKIPQELEAKLFEMFFSTKGANGSGLGLAVTRKIVMEHGGRLELDQTCKQGKVFRIAVPCLNMEN